VAIQVIKAIYGLPEAVKLWRDVLHRTLIKIGLKQFHVAKCLYIQSSTGLLVGVHVDDMLAEIVDDKIIDIFESKLKLEFNVTSKHDSFL
jgi:hypothetical protein